MIPLEQSGPLVTHKDLGRCQVVGLPLNRTICLLSYLGDIFDGDLSLARGT